MIIKVCVNASDNILSVMLQVLAPQSIMFPGLHPMAMMSTGRGFCGAPPPFPPPMYAPLPGQGAQQGAGDSQETTYLYIPNNAVGAIIGTKGSHIRNIIRFSNASVKIAPLEQDKPSPPPAPAGAEGPGAQLERKVTIVGSPEAQWKAQYLIFEKMREEGFMSGSDDVRLTVEIVVPSSQVGRIIGKGGQNVRELQRVTGSLIKLPEQPQPPGSPPHDADTTVHIVGPFYSVQVTTHIIYTSTLTLIIYLTRVLQLMRIVFFYFSYYILYKIKRRRMRYGRDLCGKKV